jgi:hypothetical protein
VSGCIFCGRSPQTKTHIFRKAWIERLMMPAEGPFGMVLNSADFTGAARESEWPAEDFGMAPNAACRDCNSGWMDQVDRAAEQIVEPMVLGHKATIRRYLDQKAVARWISQVAILCDESQFQQVIPAEMRHAFYLDKEPLPGMLVWLARTVSGWSVEMWVRAWLVTRGAEPRTTDRPNLYLVTFRVIELVVQALVPLDGTTWHADRSGNMRHLRKAWPSTYTPVSWPPAAVLPAEDLDTFAKSFEPPNVKPGEMWIQPGP